MSDAALLMDRMYRRQRHIYDLTRKFYLLGRDGAIASLKPGPGETVLEIGCGTGRNLVAVARRFPQAKVFGLDVSSEMLASARAAIRRAGLEERIALAQGDATDFDPQALLIAEIPGNRGQWRAPRQNGNGNGRPNGNGNGAAAKPKPTQPQLRIVLEETDDPDGDEERLRTLMDAIKDYAGGDPVRLQIRQTDGAEVEMELPSARYCPELTRRIGDILGPWGNVYA